MKEFNYPSPSGKITIFCRAENSVYLKRLFGLDCGFYGQDTGPFSCRGLLILNTSIGRFESEELKLTEIRPGQDGLRIIWETPKVTLKIESRWKFCRKTGIWSRKDRLQNSGPAEITLFGCLSRFVFSPGHYEIYSQGSRWCNENQGIWQTLSHGTILLGCEGGRTCQGGTPYLGLREQGQQTGVAFHILPCGNWIIRVGANSNFPPFAVVELGLSDDKLRMNLPAGASIELPEILFQELPEGKPHLGAPALHLYLIKNHFKSAKSTAPVVYNTWFDTFDNLDPERLQKQLTAVREIGCEVFTVDAGWYGTGNYWYEETGNWQEKTRQAFRGRMSDFADKVRSAGLGFGLWMEPERIAPSAPVLKEHPEWFLTGSNKCYYPDLKNPKAYNYLRSEISRLIERYRLVWLKVDFNFDLGVDSSGAEFADYYAEWYRMLEVLRSGYPQVFFEGCASGGLRLDIATLCRFDGHFLSDTVDPVDTLRIYQGSLLRVPPGRITKWTVLRSVGQSIPQCSLVAPAGPNWERSITVNLDFACRVCLPGMFGLSGDICGLPKETRRNLAGQIRFFKKWRQFISGSIGHLLTPPEPKETRTGWAGIQMQNPERKENLFFVYRLDDGNSIRRFYLRELEPHQKYRLKNEACPDQPPVVLTGFSLMSEGFTVELPQRNTAAVFVISR